MAVFPNHAGAQRVSREEEPTAMTTRPIPGAADIPSGAAPSPEPGRIEHELLQRIKSEFLEMPGLRLTRPQARRLWGLDDVSCSALLAALVDSQFLFQTRDGAFMRIEHAQARAQLTSPRAHPAVA
jgi:hypothetical protein